MYLKEFGEGGASTVKGRKASVASFVSVFFCIKYGCLSDIFVLSKCCVDSVQLVHVFVYA